MSLKLNKYFCKGCEIMIGPTNEYIKKCGDCGSNLLEKKEISAEDWIRFIEIELESANHHDYIGLPEKLFNSLCNIREIPITLERELLIAQKIAESFYENI